MRWVVMRRVLGTVLFPVLISSISGCFHDIEAPTCSSLGDCPAGPGYASCESGRCFVSGGCDETGPLSGDGCCPRTEADRSDDLDCLLDDAPTGLTGLATPTLADDTVLFTGLALDRGGTSQVGLRRRDSDGRLSVPRIIGPGKIALPPVAAGGSVFTAYRDGVAQVDTATWEVVRYVPSATPAGGLLVTVPDDAPVIMWPTVAGDIVWFDTISASDTVLSGVAGPLADATAFAPVAGSRSDRVVFAWGTGTLVVLDPEAGQATATWTPPALPAVGPTVVADTVVFAGEDLRLRGLVEEDGSLREVWVSDLEARPVGGLVADPAGRVIVVLQDGRVRGFDAATGRAAGQGDFGTAMTDLAPVRCPSGRLVGVAADRTGIRTLLPAGVDGSGFTTGLRFDTLTTVATGPGIAGDRLVLGTEAGRLAVWWFPEGPAADQAIRAIDGGRDGVTDAMTGGR
jgi:hypothetical protein